jgi:hypothetical protein
VSGCFEVLARRVRQRRRHAALVPSNVTGPFDVERCRRRHDCPDGGDQVRLIGIDTPETVDRVAGAVLRRGSLTREAADGARFDPTQGELDRFGRSRTSGFPTAGTSTN